MKNRFFLAALVPVLALGCARETSTSDHDSYEKIGDDKVEIVSGVEVAAANDVVTAILSGNVSVLNHAIPTVPEAPCATLRSDIVTAAARAMNGTYTITGRGTEAARCRDVSVLYFEGAAADMALLDAVKTNTGSCYLKGAPGDFVVASKVDLGSGRWRYAIVTATATLAGNIGGAYGSWASAFWTETKESVTAYKWSHQCLPLNGRVGGEPVWVDTAGAGSSSNLRLIKGASCPPTQGKAM